MQLTHIDLFDSFRKKYQINQCVSVDIFQKKLSFSEQSLTKFLKICQKDIKNN